MRMNVARERLLSDAQGQEVSDLENYRSNGEQSVRIFGRKFKFRAEGATTQGEETIGVITNCEEETTDFDQELVRALMNNERNGNDKNGGLMMNANDFSGLSKITHMMKRNESFQSLINSQQNGEDSQRNFEDQMPVQLP